MRKLVVWGHHVDEYQEMFDLSSQALKQPLLEYGCGPSAINAELHQTNPHVVSIDPLFDLDASNLAHEATIFFDDMVKQTASERAYFDFSRYGSFEQFVEIRRKGMQACFADYNSGKHAGRYQPLDSKDLPFADFAFDLALSSHYLFANIAEQDLDFHIQAIRELARVAKEVRIFPLIDRHSQPSPLLGPVLLHLQEAQFGLEVREVSYHLQAQGNAMLRVWAQQCDIG